MSELTSSGIDRYGDATVSEVDVYQITVDAQTSPRGGAAPEQPCAQSAEGTSSTMT